MQATALGKYLLYGRARDFLALNAEARWGRGDRAARRRAEPAADWTVTEEGRGRSSLVASGKALGAGEGGSLVPVAPGEAARFAFVPAEGCAVYPEVELSASGRPLTGAPSSARRAA